MMGEKNYTEAEGMFRELVASETKALGAEDALTMRSHRGLANALFNQGQLSPRPNRSTEKSCGWPKNCAGPITSKPSMLATTSLGTWLAKANCPKLKSSPIVPSNPPAKSSGRIIRPPRNT